LPGGLIARSGVFNLPEQRGTCQAVDKLSETLNKKAALHNIKTPIETPIDYRKIQENKKSASGKMTMFQADEIIKQAVDLISNEDFRPYFYKTLYLIGPANFYEAMDYARKQQVNCQPCIFAKRLKEYRDRKSQV
jgi:hypothetical protein